MKITSELRNTIENHIVSGNFTYQDLLKMCNRGKQSVILTSLAGSPLHIDLSDGIRIGSLTVGDRVMHQTPWYLRLKVVRLEATLKNTQKQILIAVGTISSIIGIIGIVGPILPTVPFLLLSEFCFAWAATL